MWHPLWLLFLYFAVLSPWAFSACLLKPCAALQESEVLYSVDFVLWLSLLIQKDEFSQPIFSIPG